MGNPPKKAPTAITAGARVIRNYTRDDQKLVVNRIG